MITQIIKFIIHPEYQNEFTQALLANKAGTTQEENNISMALFVEKSDPNVFFAHECWQDEAAIEHHMQQPYTQKMLKLCQKALVEAPQVLNVSEAKPGALLPIAISPNLADELCIVFFIFKIDPQYHQALLTQFENHIVQTRQEAGNLLFNFYTVDGDTSTMALYEHWQNEAALWDVHFQQPYAKETGALLEKAIIGDMPNYMHFVREL